MNRVSLIAVSAVAGLLSCFFSALAAEPVMAGALKIQLVPDRQDALYSCGEKVIFEGLVTRGGQPVSTGTASIRVSNDGMTTISTQVVDLAEGNPFKVEGGMTVPGFLRCEVKVDNEKACGAAGFEPEKIQPAPNLPDDFKAFWENGDRELGKIPLDARMEPLAKYSTPQYDCFKVSFANLSNTRIYGFLTVPKGKKGPFPALVSVHGAGHGFFAPETGWAKSGAIVLLMNVHQYDPPTDKQAIDNLYAELNKPMVYFLQGVEDRDRYYLKKSILGINRAINWLADLPEVDKEHLAIYGTSQGGGFALIMAGLNKNIRAVSANVPALCDHAGYRLGRTPGWPQMVSGNNTEKLKTSGYYDAVNFARYITCPIILSVGFIDTSCSPSSVYAAFNTIRAPKMMFNEPAMGHSQSKRFGDYQRDWLLGKLGLGRELPPVK